MKTALTKALASTLALAALILASPAQATLVAYTVDAVAPLQLASPIAAPADAPWGANGYPGDTLSLQSYSGGFDLTVGTSIQKINALDWTVNYTYGGTATDPNAWSDVQSAFTLSRQIQIGEGTAILTQTGLLTAGWDNDYLHLNAGSTATLYTQGYRIDITTLATPYGGAGSDGGATTFDGGNPWTQPSQDLYAQFVVTQDSGMAAAPEPGSIAALMGLAALSLGSSAVSRMRSKKHLALFQAVKQ
ncbi:MAG: hypothetical protein WCO68_06520 [Verrucomicrobiota bacterium]